MRTLFTLLFCLTALSAFAQNTEVFVARTDGSILVLDKNTGTQNDEFSITLPPTIDSVWNAVDIEYNPVNDSLYISGGNAHTIVVMGIDGSSQRPLLNTANPTQFPQGSGVCCEHLGFSLDPANDRLFFQSGPPLLEAPLDGVGGIAQIYTDSDSEYVIGVDYNSQDGKVYFSVQDGTNSGINAINADATGLNRLYPGADFRHLVVDEVSGTIFWTDWDGLTIQSGPIAGGTATTIVSGLTNRPFGIDFDTENDKLYFTTISGQLFRVDPDGSNLEMVANNLGQTRGVSVKGGGPALSIDDYQQLPVNVYPNPSQGSFVIEFEKSTAEPYTISVFNTLGSKVYETAVSEGQMVVKEKIELTTATGLHQYVITSASGEKLAAGQIVVTK